MAKIESSWTQLLTPDEESVVARLRADLKAEKKRSAARSYPGLVSHLFVWLREQGMSTSDLDADVLAAFVQHRDPENKSIATAGSVRAALERVRAMGVPVGDVRSSRGAWVPPPAPPPQPVTEPAPPEPEPEPERQPESEPAREPDEPAPAPSPSDAMPEFSLLEDDPMTQPVTVPPDLGGYDQPLYPPPPPAARPTVTVFPPGTRVQTIAAGGPPPAPRPASANDPVARAMAQGQRLRVSRVAVAQDAGVGPGRHIVVGTYSGRELVSGLEEFLAQTVLPAIPLPRGLQVVSFVCEQLGPQDQVIAAREIALSVPPSLNREEGPSDLRGEVERLRAQLSADRSNRDLEASLRAKEAQLQALQQQAALPPPMMLPPLPPPVPAAPAIPPEVWPLLLAPKGPDPAVMSVLQAVQAQSAATVAAVERLASAVATPKDDGFNKMMLMLLERSDADKRDERERAREDRERAREAAEDERRRRIEIEEKLAAGNKQTKTLMEQITEAHSVVSMFRGGESEKPTLVDGFVAMIQEPEKTARLVDSLVGGIAKIRMGGAAPAASSDYTPLDGVEPRKALPAAKGPDHAEALRKRLLPKLEALRDALEQRTDKVLREFGAFISEIVVAASEGNPAARPTLDEVVGVWARLDDEAEAAVYIRNLFRSAGLERCSREAGRYWAETMARHYGQVYASLAEAGIVPPGERTALVEPEPVKDDEDDERPATPAGVEVAL